MHFISKAPNETRTHNLSLTRRLLYTIELLGQLNMEKNEKENLEKKVGLEPTTFSLTD